MRTSAHWIRELERIRLRIAFSLLGQFRQLAAQRARRLLGPFGFLLKIVDELSYLSLQSLTQGSRLQSSGRLLVPFQFRRLELGHQLIGCLAVSLLFFPQSCMDCCQLSFMLRLQLVQGLHLSCFEALSLRPRGVLLCEFIRDDTIEVSTTLMQLELTQLKCLYLLMRDRQLALELSNSCLRTAMLERNQQVISKVAHFRFVVVG
eukprot:m.548700 g.548700  ORF g.548700 m.548700 type:complete len:205 (+) comp57718_c0_seq2:2796-3410(+)